MVDIHNYIDKDLHHLQLGYDMYTHETIHDFLLLMRLSLIDETFSYWGNFLLLMRLPLIEETFS